MRIDSKSTHSIALNGFAYRFFERVGAQIINTVVTIILARLLLPEDYGIVPLASVIISLCDVFVTYGFGNSLVQKQKVHSIDYSTTFYFSLCLSIVVYVLLYAFAPSIAIYYNIPLLSSVIRVMGLRLPFAAVNSVQNAYISRKFLFRKFFFSTLGGSTISGLVGILMAYTGYGIWALVAQYLISVISNTLILLLTVSWRPKKEYSWTSFRELFSYGWKILIEGFFDEAYEQIRSIIIGKKYTTSDLSYYTKGKQFPSLFINSISITITNVMFPVYSAMQGDLVIIRRALRRTVQISNYILLPLLFCFVAIAENFILVFLNEAWLPCVPYIQLFSLMYIFKPIKHVNKSVIKALGRSDLILTTSIIEKLVGIAIMFIAMQYGPFAIAISAAVTYVIGAIINVTINVKIVSYKLSEQIIDFVSPLVISIFTAVCVYLVGIIFTNHLISLIIQIVVGICLYISVSVATRNKTFHYIIHEIMERLDNDKSR